MKWHLEKIKVSNLIEWEKNPRNLTEKGLKQLKDSIKEFGLAEPLVINSDYTICGGHGRKKILEELNIDEVDCYLPDKKLTEKQFQKLNLRLNKNIAGEWNTESLLEFFDNDMLYDVGFEDYELKNFDVDISNMGVGVNNFINEESNEESITFQFHKDNVDMVKEWLKKHSKEEMSNIIIDYCINDKD